MAKGNRGGKRGGNHIGKVSTTNGKMVDAYETVPQGWTRITGALTAPAGYEWYSNGKSRFSRDYKQGLVRSRK
jgi:hypothetical protein